MTSTIPTPATIIRKIAKLGAASRCAYDTAAEKLAYDYCNDLAKVQDVEQSDFGTLRQKVEAFRYGWSDIVARRARIAGANRLQPDLDILITIATQIVRTELVRLNQSGKLIAIREAQSRRHQHALRCQSTH